MLSLRCQGCATEVAIPQTGAVPLVCPKHGDGGDHVLLPALPLPSLCGDQDESQPFLRFADRMLAFHRCTAIGRAEMYADIVRRLDARITTLTGQSFSQTPLFRSEALSEHFGLSEHGGVWIKNETGNPGGSHKGRHLFALMVELFVGEALTSEPQKQTPAPLAIASCGNAALAAAVVAKAAERRLLVFIPTDAEASVVSALRDLDAEITVCERRAGESGDPCYLRFQAAVRSGAIPFCCQGPDNGLTIEGGQTLLAEALCEISRTGRTLSRVMVQVGGGALASSCALAIETGLHNGLLQQRPRFYTAQTESAAPLLRAWQRLLDAYGEALPTLSDSGWSQVAAHKRRYMWPWEQAPHSVAHGILDDETYDWLSVIQAMARSAGRPLVAPEQTIVAAHSLAVRATEIAVTATGTAGLAGLLQLQKEEPLHPHENVLCLFTGVMR